MDVATHLESVDAELEAFISRQADKVAEDRAGQQAANAQEAEMRAREKRRARQLHKENRAAWYVHFCRMAESHRRISEDYERRAEALQEGAA